MKLGSSVNTRTEKHGDDSVPACDIPIAGLMLEKHEVDELVGKHYWSSIFNTGNRGKADQPLFPNIASHKMVDKYEGTVLIDLGPNVKAVELEAVKISGITLTPHAGGLVEMSFKIQTAEDIEKFVHKLVARLDTEIDLELTIGEKVEKAKSKQQDLPINTFGEGEQQPAPVH